MNINKTFKPIKKKNNFWCLLLVVSIFSSCNLEGVLDDNKDSADEQTNFSETDRQLQSLQELDQPEPLTEPQEIETIEDNIEDGNYICSIKKYRAAPEYNEMIVLDPTTDVIYPGAIIKGETISTGEYTPIVADRTPLTLSISLENLDGDIAKEVTQPSLSTVRQAIRDILSQDVTGATPASLSFEITEVHSSEQLQLAIGANYNYNQGVLSVKGGFDFNNQKAKSRIMVKFIQKYYSVDIDLPKNPSDLFVSPPNLSSLGSISPMYVSTVTYGRLALFTVESESATTEIKAALEVAFNSGVHSGGVDLSVEQQKMLQTSSIKGTILGGSGADAAASITGYDGLKSYIENGGNYSKDSPGAPMSYKLRYLKDNAIGNIVLSSEYNVRNCVATSSGQVKYIVSLDQIVFGKGGDPGSNGEYYGTISVSAIDSRAGSIKSEEGRNDLWSKTSSSHESVSLNGGAVSIGKTATFIFSNPDTANSYLNLSAWMKESDDGELFAGGDESLGSNSRHVYLNQVTGETISLALSGDGYSATAYFTIKIAP